MSKVLKNYFLLAIAGLVVLAQPLMAAEDGIRGNLVSVQWLEKNLKSPDIVIIDASPGQIYALKHIPGAVSYDVFTYGVPDLSTADMEKRFQSLGISPGKKIVLYDQGGTYLATRALFSLDYYGFPEKDLLILDGGMAKWQATGLPVTKDPTPAAKPGTFKITKVNKDVRVDLPEFLTASGDTANNVLVEALEPNWHFGELLVLQKAGHPPNAVMAPSADFFNPDKTFKSADEIRVMLNYLGISPEKTVHSFCGGGIAASVPYFAAKFIAKYPKVKLFPGSELEWLSDPRDLPYWTYDAPYMLRDSKWLLFSTSQMPRMYGVAKVSIVDLRPADEYKQGHIPFALNVPAEVFKSNVGTPEKLAEVLGPAGVKASEEAVLISGAGLTKESALAYVALEKLGQKKVAVFTDSMEQWAKAGFAVKKDPTAVGARKGPGDVSIVPAAYVVKPRNEGKSGSGAYPRVYIASGKEMPAKSPDGKVVHVPYTELLNADGTPKAAKDIWNILTKAGVPRYAELVCIADDPGEAAVNYFILKLMGYPDIKVLVG